MAQKGNIQVNSQTQSDAFIKQLASSDPQLRESSLEALRTFLSRRDRFSDLELLKLWKGLFYCIWMSDKPRPQQQLAQDLASLVSSGTLAADNALPFVNAFWITMAREWVGIDVLRMNKYLYVARQMLLASMQHVSQHGWARDLLQQHAVILERTPLNVNDARIPNGLRYHVLDIYVDEIEKVLKTSTLSNSDEGDDSHDKIVRALLKPVTVLRQKSPTKPIRQRAADTLADAAERLGVELDLDAAPHSTTDQDSTDDADDNEEWTGFGE